MEIVAERDLRFWPKADMPKNAIYVAMGGKADMSGFGLLLRKLTPEPHSAGRKSLL